MLASPLALFVQLRAQVPSFIGREPVRASFARRICPSGRRLWRAIGDGREPGCELGPRANRGQRPDWASRHTRGFVPGCMASRRMGAPLGVAMAPGLLAQFVAQAGAFGGLESSTMRLGIHAHDRHPSKKAQPPPTGRPCNRWSQQAQIAQAGHPLILIRTRDPRSPVRA